MGILKEFKEGFNEGWNKGLYKQLEIKMKISEWLHARIRKKNNK